VIPKEVKSMAKLSFKKGSTLKEAGLSAAQGKALEEAGKIERIGVRETGKRGRPATEYRVVR
jgi:hypothetical protein